MIECNPIKRYRTKPAWVLSSEWAVSRDPYNWILQRKTINRCRNVGYYPTPEMLLQSLHLKILLTSPAKPDMIQHIEADLQVVQACSERFAVYIHTHIGAAAKMTPQTAAASLGRQYG